MASIFWPLRSLVLGNQSYPPPELEERARASVLLSKKSAPFVNGSSLLTESRRSRRSRRAAHRDRGQLPTVGSKEVQEWVRPRRMPKSAVEVRSPTGFNGQTSCRC